MNEKSWDKIAEEYHEQIISPFQKNVKNPLVGELLKIKDKKNKILGEFGCGRLELGKTLCENFKKICAYDFSQEMIRIAKEKNPYDNLELSLEDMTKIKIFKKFDVAVSVNSILMPSIKKVRSCFKNIYNSLKNKGTLFLIVPSMESVLYGGFLVLNRESKKKEDSEAIRDTKRIVEDKKYDYFLGYYRDGKDIQKFFYKHELIYFLEKAGFKNLKIGKVEYPWKKEISDYENFPKEKPLWDWFVRCEKN